MVDQEQHPETLIEAIPHPDVIRDQLAEAIRQAALLRSLLRVAERKAKYVTPQFVGQRGEPRRAGQESRHAP